MSDGGSLTIRVEGASAADTNLALRAGDYVRISVSDNGMGMDEATLKRCTEPFFTTKGVGKGTGLGLSSVHGMAVQSGGALHVTSVQGSGTTVSLWLPMACEEHLPAQDALATMPQAIGEKLVVLVVDDEALVGHVTATLLEDLGHQASWVPDGAHAIEALEAGTKVDLLISDHAMPGMTGSQLAERARALRPTLPIILATGFADLPGEIAQTLPRLEKPYGPKELAQAINLVFPGREAFEA
jgi:CheY-like chemotaxis protein